MKRIAMISALLVLTVALLTGCGCTRRDAGMDTMPSTEMTILPTNIPETTVPTMPSTEAPTEPATDATMESGIMGTEEGTMESGTGETGARSRIR